MPFLRAIGVMLMLAAFAASMVLVVRHLSSPSGRRWTRPDLSAPVGLTTSPLLAGSDGPSCTAALSDAGVAVRLLPARASGACSFDDGVTWWAGGSREAAYRPAAPPLACPLAAALAVWEWNVVQPAAVATLGSPIVRIDHVGSYACRRIYGRAEGPWSGHARARAIDITGFRLADGRQITVVADWNDPGAAGAFLHRVRDGGCRIFSLTLSPDYNAAHRDHLHLEEATCFARVCR